MTVVLVLVALWVLFLVLVFRGQWVRSTRREAAAARRAAEVAELEALFELPSHAR